MDKKDAVLYSTTDNLGTYTADTAGVVTITDVAANKIT